VAEYRTFRNTDPPRLVTVWNEAFAGRGAVRLRSSLPLESHVFAKPYFDPAGLIVAEEHGVCAGFVHAGFGANAERTALSHQVGVTCILAVRPEHRRRGIGSELLRRSEEYLRQRGASELCAGQRPPADPFYLGLYGGAELPGFLDSDSHAGPFFLKHGYVAGLSTLVLQRRLNQPIKLLDPRAAGHRQNFDLDINTAPARKLTWWRGCTFGLMDPLLFALIDRLTGEAAASAFAYELDGFSWRWGQPTVGVVDLQVQPTLRRQGLARFLLTQILRYVQEQFFELVELHVGEGDTPALRLCQSLGFTQVDVGRVYRRPLR
jgi:ribosomal protein S18 acetylase RimI-like enzyme